MTDTTLNQIVQIGIVVKDARATANRYRDLLGLDDWRFNEVDTLKGKGSNFRTGNKAIDAKALIAWIPLGSVELELIEPRDDDSVYAEFLRVKGPGIHHVMFEAPDYKNCVNHMNSCGISTLASGELQDTRFHLFDTLADLGLICEIAEGGPLIEDSTA